MNFVKGIVFGIAILLLVSPQVTMGDALPKDGYVAPQTMKDDALELNEGLEEVSQEEEKKIVVDYENENTTQYRDVRTQNHAVTVGYKVAENAMLGVEASKEFSDSYDASAAGRSMDMDESLKVKYKLSF